METAKSPTGEQTHTQKLTDTCSGIQFSHQKTVLTHGVTGLNPEDIVINEISLSPKEKSCRISLTGDSQKNQGDRQQDGGGQRWRKRGMGN
jgi:hypothetical protein